MTYPAAKGAAGMEDALERLCDRAEAAVHGRYNIIVLSDRNVGADRIPIPALLATAAVHHHLISRGLRTSVGLVVETGEAREVHHFACLAGYGAEAINPYLAFETLDSMRRELPEEVDEFEVVKRYIKSIDKGLLKVMSKMGISTYQSYCGAQIFDAVGLSTAFVGRYFTGTAQPDRGRRPARDRAGDGEPPQGRLRRRARARRRSSTWAATTPSACAARRTAGRPCRSLCSSTPCAAIAGRSTAKFAKLLNDQSERLLTLRGLFRMQERGGETGAPPCRWRRWSGRQVHRPALLLGRHELRLDLARGAHHARHRDEPHRRQVEHRRGRRGERPLQARWRTAIPCARPSSRSPPAASASRRSTSSIPT